MADFATKTGTGGTPVPNTYDSTPALTDRVPITGGRESTVGDLVDTVYAEADSLGTGTALAKVLGVTAAGAAAGRSNADAMADMLATAGVPAAVGAAATYMQPWNGSDVRKYVDRISEFVSLMDFIPEAERAAIIANTSTYDCATSFLNAIASGVPIFIPNGTYVLLSSVVLLSNTIIVGAGLKSIVKSAANSVRMFTTDISLDKSNIILSNFVIDGGGQTTDVYTGIRACIGIYATRVSGLLIDKVTVRNMGVIKSALTPTDDATYGGFGILIEARYGSVSRCYLNRCYVHNIAGGGMGQGDGVYFSGYQTASGYSDLGAIVHQCYVENTGRHSFTVAGGTGVTSTKGGGVTFVDCVGKNASLCGIDLEEGQNVKIIRTKFTGCGVYTGYYNPVTEFGATYRLLAGIAIGLFCDDIRIDDVDIDSCQHGITECGLRILINNVVISNSVQSDFIRRLGGSSNNLVINNSEFKTNLPCLSFYNSTATALQIYNTNFYGNVQISASVAAIIAKCTFRSGFSVVGGSAGFSKNTISECTFLDYAGPGFKCDGSAYLHPDNLISKCRFIGTGTMTYGVSLAYRSVSRLRVEGCEFSGLTAGIISTNISDQADQLLANDNLFISCVDGIKLSQGMNGGSISNNTFGSISGKCIDIYNIGAASNLLRTNITNNLSLSSCVNGLYLTISSGNGDYNIIGFNNFSSCSGTKYSIASITNANGSIANNI